MEEKIKAKCIWMGPDIIVDNKGIPYMLYENVKMKKRVKHGISFKGTMDLTIKEAMELRDSLNMAIMQWNEIEESANDYFDNKQ